MNSRKVSMITTSYDLVRMKYGKEIRSPIKWSATPLITLTCNTTKYATTTHALPVMRNLTSYVTGEQPHQQGHERLCNDGSDCHTHAMPLQSRSRYGCVGGPYP